MPIAVPPPAAHFAAPLQPWRSADGHVALLRPASAAPATSDAPLGALMARGWRLVWDGSAMRPGRVLVRLALPVRPASAAEGRATEVLQVGVSSAPGAVRACLREGLGGGAGARGPDRTINGVRYAAWTNGDAGMSQHIAATDLRAVIGGRCYAMERFRYAIAAGVADTDAQLGQAEGAALLDAALASLRIASGRAALPLTPALRMPPHTVVR